MADPAPIALFAFNRPQRTAETLAALAANELAERSDLVVFCDGPRRSDEEPATEQVRELARSATGFRQVTVVERPENLGLARSLIGGISQMLESRGSVIVVEDDLLTSPFFLRYMNDGLQRYADDEGVFSLCGYSYPVWRDLPGPFFLPGAHPWGWATWPRAWSHFEKDETKLLHSLDERGLLYDFDIAGSYPHTGLLMQSIAGEVHSWALRWIGSAILHDGLTLYPAETLVRNTGIGDQATNRWGDEVADVYNSTLADTPPSLPGGPPEASARALEMLRAFLLRTQPTSGLKERIVEAVVAGAPRSLGRRLYTARLRRAIRHRGLVSD